MSRGTISYEEARDYDETVYNDYSYWYPYTMKQRLEMIIKELHPSVTNRYTMIDHILSITDNYSYGFFTQLPDLKYVFIKDNDNIMDSIELYLIRYNFALHKDELRKFKDSQLKTLFTDARDVIRDYGYPLNLYTDGTLIDSEFMGAWLYGSGALSTLESYLRKK